MTIRLIIADDHLVVRTGLRAILDAHADLDVVGEAATGTEATTLAARLHPDVAAAPPMADPADRVVGRQAVDLGLERW